MQSSGDDRGGLSSPYPLSVIPLGGVGEIGKNMTAYAFEDDLLVVDAGLMFPDESMPGVDLVMPDVAFLEAHRGQLRGYLITHGHEDHIGALAYALQRAPAPVFATRLTRGLIEARLKESKLLDRTELVTIEPGVLFRIGAFEVAAFHQCHSIPDAVGFALRTPHGTVVHSGDYKFDLTPVDGRTPAFGSLARLGTEGVLALVGDSTRADTPGNTPSEATVRASLLRIVGEAPGRVIVATFASQIARLQLAIDAAAAHQRRVVVVGRSMVNNVSIAVQLGYLRVPAGVMARVDDLPRLPAESVAILTTGSQGEQTSALVRMAEGAHKHVRIAPGDTVILSSSPIPGNEESVARTVDNLLRLGATVMDDRVAHVHVSGHGAAEDLKLMLGLVRPRYLIPVHGQHRQLSAHRELAVLMGMDRERVLLLENGAVVRFDDGVATRAGSVDAGAVFVDRTNLSRMPHGMLRDRRMMARDGVVVLLASIDRRQARPAGAPGVILRGMAGANADALIEMAHEVLYDALGSQPSLADDLNHLAAVLQERFTELLYQQTRRRPLVVPVVTGV